MDDERRWLEQLDGYIEWRREDGGRGGAGASHATVQNLKSILGRWFSYALRDGLVPMKPDQAALESYLDSLGEIAGSTRDDYREHIRRLWKRWPDFEAACSQRLAKLVAEFRRGGSGSAVAVADGVATEGGSVGGYSLADQGAHLRARERLEEILRSLPTMQHAERQQLKEVWKPKGEGSYGGVGQIVQLGSFIDRASDSEWEAFRSKLGALCFGQDDLADRLQEAVDGISGLGWASATRVVAVLDPQRVVPNYTLYNAGRWAGKFDSLQMLIDEKLLDAEALSRAETVLREHPRSRLSGRAVVESNDLLLEILRPHFTNGESVDTWGMRTFLYWLSERCIERQESIDDAGGFDDSGLDALVDAAGLERLADELLCDVGFLKDIVALLEDKRQVIFYGPPGTGKTYFAQRLSQALAGVSYREMPAGEGEDAAESDAFSLVQFHPAYSYEDFFEGYRPQVDGEGQMTYRLTPGPLLSIAEKARDDRSQRHVMVIDEINRANLPRVLGELLYLLEYRNESIQTQYRPNGNFSLPENLWFIGTMNTADRSIALVDAAMRRRFHFVPFFPDREPTAGLLRRWSERNEQGQMWIADLLDGVNERLRSDLGGDHMLIGPSHFMKSNLSKDGVRRIWEYNIEPLMEDQFFGRQEVIDRYRFREVWKRHGPGATASGSGTRTLDGPVDDGETHSAGDEGAESYGDG